MVLNEFQASFKKALKELNQNNRGHKPTVSNHKSLNPEEVELYPLSGKSIQ
jgi:hypothetical protein